MKHVFIKQKQSHTAGCHSAAAELSALPLLLSSLQIRARGQLLAVSFLLLDKVLLQLLFNLLHDWMVGRQIALTFQLDVFDGDLRVANHAAPQELTNRVGGLSLADGLTRLQRRMRELECLDSSCC